jgi:hypothetical protein
VDLIDVRKDRGQGRHGRTRPQAKTEGQRVRGEAPGAGALGVLV